MKDPCKNCIVQPMCNSGCIEIWNYRNYLKKRHKRNNRISSVLIWTSLIQSSLWGILLMLDVLNHVDHWHVSINDYTFSILWQYCPWLVVISTAFYFITSCKIIRRKVSRISNGNCSEYIWRKEVEEAQKFREEGGDATI